MTRRTTHDVTAKRKKKSNLPIIFKEGIAGLQGGIGGRLRRRRRGWGKLWCHGGIIQPKQMGKGAVLNLPATGIPGGVLVMPKRGRKTEMCISCGRHPKKEKGRGPKIRYLRLR